MADRKKPAAILVNNTMTGGGTLVTVGSARGETIIIDGVRGDPDAIVDAQDIGAVYARNVDVTDPKLKPEKETRRKLWAGWRPPRKGD